MTFSTAGDGVGVAYDVPARLEVEAGRYREALRLRRGGEGDEVHHVARELEARAGADPAGVHDLRAEGVQDRARDLERRPISPDHHRERAVGRTHRPTGHRGVEHRHSVRRREVGECGRRVRRDGRVDDDHLSLARALEDLVEHPADLLVVAHHHAHHVGGGGQRADRIRDVCPGGAQLLASAPRDVVHRQVESCVGQAQRHRLADGPQPDEADRGHGRKVWPPSTARIWPVTHDAWSERR